MMESLGCKGSGLTLSQLVAKWNGKDPNQLSMANWWVNRIGHYKLVDISATLVREQLNALAEGPCIRGHGLVIGR